MTAEVSDLLALVASLYDTVTDPGLWTTALRRLSGNMGALGVALCVRDMTRRQVVFRAAYNQPSERHRHRASDELPPSDGAHTALSHLVDLLPRGNALRYTFGAPLEADAAARHYLIARFWLRPDAEGADSYGSRPEVPSGHQDVLSRWRALEPNLRHVLRMRQDFEQMELRAAAAEVTEVLSCGLLLFDGRGAVRHMNQAAKEHLARGNGLVIMHDGTVGTFRECDRQAFSGLLAGALARIPAAGCMALRRPDSLYPYVLQVQPLALNRKSKGRDRLAAALLVRETSTGADVPPADLRQLFGLTEREAELASRIVRGEQLTASAKQLGMTVKTARHHLEAILRKTDTRRQAEVIALVHSFALWWSGTERLAANQGL